MSKIVPTSISSGFQSTAQINNNFAALADELNNNVLYRNNPVGEPNTMNNDIDMNSKSLLNVLNINGVPASGLTDLSGYVNNAAVYANNSLTYSQNSLTYSNNSAASAANSASSASASAASATSCSIYSSLGLSATTLFDLGSVADTVIVFPTDWGLLV